MAANLNTIDIFKKAFELFQGSNGYLPSSEMKKPPQMLPSISNLLYQSPSNEFSISKILQSNNEILNKPPSNCLVSQANDMNAKKLDLINQNCLSSNENEQLGGEPSQMKLDKNLITSNSSQKEKEDNSPESSLLNSQTNSSHNHEESFTSISSLPESDKQYQEGDDDYADECDENNETATNDAVNEESNSKSEIDKPLSGRERRTKFTDLQTRVLNEKFRANRYPKENEMASMANDLGLNKRVVSVWFQNTRQKNRKNGENSVTADQASLNANEESDDSQSLTSLKSSSTISGKSTATDSILASLIVSNKKKEIIMKETSKSKKHHSDVASLPTAGSITPVVQQPTPQYPQFPQIPKLPFPFPPYFNQSALPLHHQQAQFSNPMLMFMLYHQMQQQPQPFQQSQLLQQYQQLATVQPQPQIQPEAQMSAHQDESMIQNSKRVRTKMSRLQLNVVRLVFVECKIPNQKECEFMGHALNLNKKVIQTWFQNNRAKEKKILASSCVKYPKPYMLYPVMNSLTDLTSFDFAEDECLVCNLSYETGESKCGEQHGEQDSNDSIVPLKRAHLFSKQHLAKLIEFVMNLSDENENNDNDHDNTINSTDD